MFGRSLRAAAAALVVIVAGAGNAVAQSYDGSGLVKFGAFAQGMFLNVDQSLPTVATAEPSGWGGGVSAGYDLRLHERFLLGIEIDGSFGDARERADITDYGFDYLFTARGRLGAYVAPHWLIYGTAGVGFLGIETQIPGIGQKASETLTGYVVGAGTEVDWHHVILFGEYLYGDFGDRSFTISNGNALAPVEWRHNASVEAHLVRLGIKFKVGHDYAHDYDHPQDYRRKDSLK